MNQTLWRHGEERRDEAPHPCPSPKLGEGTGGVIDALAAIWQTGRKIAFLGVGSPLRGDDAVGLYLVAELEKCLPPAPERELRFYSGESAPENFTGEIRRFAPTHLILCDAARMDAPPGTFAVIDPASIGGVSFTTHTLPLKIIVDYLIATTGCQVTIIGIQPHNLEFACPLSPAVKAGADHFVDAFEQRIGLASTTE